jgi:hypothetical protein
MSPCPECGGHGCDTAFDECMALEMTDPAFFQLHHLTVAAFMVQHPSRLSAHGWREERGLLAEFLAGVPPVEVRRRPQPHGPSLTRGAPVRLPPVQWSATISGIPRGDSVSYVTAVLAWARTVATEAPSVGDVEDTPR